MHQAQDITSPMAATERRATLALAGIFALRMMGLFMIFPVFSLFAQHLDGATPFLIGLAISVYGLTQALFQIPFGLLSDRFGRKRVITVGLVIFGLGSAVAALSHSIYGVIAGRAIQGGGAIASPVMALAADLTREVQRTKAMGIIGISIGLSFALSLVLGPVVAGAAGVHGIFWLTSVLALGGILVLYGLVPNPGRSHFHRDTEAAPAQFMAVLKHGDLVRLNFGILCLHTIMTAVFVAVPIIMKNAAVSVSNQWAVYLPILALSIATAVPFIIVAEKKHKMKAVFLGAVAVVGSGNLGLYGFHETLVGIAGSLFLFFCGFNLLEATLPSMISKLAPADLKGTALGFYSTSQFLGAFLGGISGGWIYGAIGLADVFLFCAAVALSWLLVAFQMKAPRQLTSLLLTVGDVTAEDAPLISNRLLQVEGVAEAVVLAEDGVAYLKVDAEKLDRDRLQTLIPRA